MNATAVMPDEASLHRMYARYVEGFDSKPRHGKAVNAEVEKFDAYLGGACNGNMKLHYSLFNRMMSCAVEFEESGFIAGVQYALLHGNEPWQPEPAKAEDSATVADEQPHEADPEPEALSWSITTRQMADMFETVNSKIVRRIENQIFPTLDAQSRLNFRKETGYTAQRKKYAYYRLNKAACEIYMMAMEPHKKYVNIAGGLAKMEELMKTVFPKEQEEIA